MLTVHDVVNMLEDVDEVDDLGDILDTSFEDGGRWHDLRITVVKIEDQYFRITKQVRATEYQENGSTFVVEVDPYEVNVIRYRRKGKEVEISPKY